MGEGSSMNSGRQTVSSNSGNPTGVVKQGVVKQCQRTVSFNSGRPKRGRQTRGRQTVSVNSGRQQCRPKGVVKQGVVKQCQ